MLDEKAPVSIKSPKAKKEILIVGDWVVDDHLVTGIHRSATASRTGRAHYRALHPPRNPARSFCAAGKVAWILHQARIGGDEFCEILGVGLWNEDDTKMLTAMLDPSFVKKQTPHKITAPEPHRVAGLTLFNLGEAVKAEDPSGQLHGPYGTTRVIRVYQQIGAQTNLIERIDWELPECSGENAWVTDENALKHSNLNKVLEDKKYWIDAVLIKDICKGTISRELISWLAEKFEKVPWFVSTKAWRPDWLKELRKVDLRLLMVPQVAAQTAVRTDIVSCWITRSGKVSKDALIEMDKLAEEFGEAPTIVVLPHGLTTLARDCDEHPLKGVIQSVAEPSSLPADTYMASLFFPALVANLIKREADKENVSLKELLRRALNFTEKWRLFEADRVKSPESWDPDDEPPLELDRSDKCPNVGSWRDIVWELAKKDWSSALSDRGIVIKDGKKRLELWRAMTEVDGYVCCVKAKRGILRKLVQEAEDFMARRRNQHRSYLLIAPPGSGKSFLVRRLAKSLRLRYLPFNITQMLSKNDILDCFDTIVTTQAQNKDESVLVFIDEINAMLQGQLVYDAFLAPLEGGVYVRAGKTFHIDPCIWIFAGTEDPVKEDDPPRDISTKASDFRSRLTLSPLDLTTDPNEEEARVERVYLGVSLLRSVFPDVRRVSDKVLGTFRLFPGRGVREIEQFVRSFINIQYGEVRAKNVPVDWLKENYPDFDTAYWANDWKEKDTVEIVG